MVYLIDKINCICILYKLPWASSLSFSAKNRWSCKAPSGWSNFNIKNDFFLIKKKYLKITQMLSFSKLPQSSNCLSVSPSVLVVGTAIIIKKEKEKKR